MTNTLTGKIEAYGVRGISSKPWRKVFKSMAAYEAWIEKNGESVEVYGIRDAD